MHSSTLSLQEIHSVLAKQAKRHKDVLDLSNRIREEIGDVWDLHQGDDVAIARQLYGSPEPSKDQLQMVADMGRLLSEFRRAYDEADRGILVRFS